MRLACFNFGEPIVWRLGGDDPLFLPLPGTDTWRIVNPLLYDKLPILSQKHNPPIQDSTKKYFWLNSEIVVAPSSNRSAAKEDLKDLMPLIGELLLRLRHLTGQANLPSLESLISTGWAEVDELPQLDLLYWAGLPGQVHFQKYMWTTAVTSELLNAAAALGSSFSPPTHEVLFLDAIGAYRDKDYRRAVLYVAISAEVAFGAVIDEAYERTLAGEADERFRVIDLPQAVGKVRKDPIFERLRNRSDFSVLVHELSLYILRRSLLVENSTLYSSAKSLYSTRNQLVHAGGLSESDSSPPYSLDERGAMAALKTGIALFSWLKVRDDFPLPEHGFV